MQGYLRQKDRITQGHTAVYGNVISLYQLCEINRVRAEDRSCANLHHVLAGMQPYSMKKTRNLLVFSSSGFFKSSEVQLLAII